jgi:ABC-type phosphate/phosphonate transport system permease subunit
MHERPLSESEEITYHATDLPAPITVGAMLWVAIGFFPLPLALLIHWLMHRMPEWARWLQSLAAYDGAALVAVLLTATVGFGLALLALRQTSDPPSAGAPPELRR